MVTRLSTVLRANRLMDLVTIRSIFPPSASSIVWLKPVRYLVEVPECHSSEYSPANCQSARPMMYFLSHSLALQHCTFIIPLQKAEEQNRLERRWRVYVRPDILIVDEVGYMQLDRTSAELFFRLICTRYERGSIILTSNKFFSDWGELMSDAAIATAMLDRLLHHAHVVNIRGESYRLKDRLKTGIQTVPPTDIPAAEHPV